MPSTQVAHVKIEAKRRQELSSLLEKSSQQPGLKEALEVYGKWRELDTILQAQRQFDGAGVITAAASVHVALVKR